MRDIKILCELNWARSRDIWQKRITWCWLTVSGSCRCIWGNFQGSWEFSLFISLLWRKQHTKPNILWIFKKINHITLFHLMLLCFLWISRTKKNSIWQNCQIGFLSYCIKQYVCERDIILTYIKPLAQAILKAHGVVMRLIWFWSYTGLGYSVLSTTYLLYDHWKKLLNFPKS